MTSHPAERPPEQSRRKPDLDGRYGQIGISAVAAAVRACTDETKGEPKQNQETVTRDDRAA